MSNISFKQVNELLKPIWDSTNYPLIVKDDAFYKVEQKPLFVYPQLKVVSENSNVRMMLISAPGAVGKTTFAKFSANMKKGYYLDLAKLKLGDNTFIGTLAKYFGSSSLGKVLADLAQGNITLFIDAFDEAEIISGWTGVEKFLRDLNEFCKESKKINTVLFSRSETAGFIKMLFDDIAGEQHYSMYEIEYFDENNSISFIENFLAEKGDKSIATHKEPFKEACKAIFSVIAAGINNKSSDIWNDDEIRSFIGYSPVLQTIGAYLYEQNFVEIRERFTNESTEKTGLHLIAQFIESLLRREQSKFLNGFTAKVSQIPNLPADINNLFDPEMQLAIVTQYVEQGCKDIGSIRIPNVPMLISKEFYESLKQFLPNHPFIRNNSFTSPAFRDYSLAYLITSTKTEYGKKYLEMDATVLTPLFAHFYADFSDSVCKGPDVGYIYESAISRQSLSDSVTLTNVKDENGHYVLEIITDEKETSQFNFTCKIDAANPLVFKRRLNHACINVSHKVVLGSAGGSLELKDVEIRAKTIQIVSKECLLNCHEGDEIYLEAAEFEQPQGVFNLKKIGEGIVKVFWPDSKVYPWSEYSLDAPEKTDQNHANTIHDLKRILGPFRKHKKEEFGKYAPFMESIIVGSSPERRKLFDHLQGLKILNLNKGTSQYVLDPNACNQYGFSWSDVKSTSVNKAVIAFIESYKAIK